MGSESRRFLGFLSLILPLWLLCSSSSSQAHTFYVGEKDGWVTTPSEDYHHWAQRNRFQVNDTLRFSYKKGSDSVMVVKKEDYDSCNTKSPMEKMEDGDSSFSLNRSGPFYFISGKAENCQKGQKLIVVVMAVRDEPRRQPSPPLVAATPSSSPRAASPKADSPANGSAHPSHEAPAPSPSGSDSIVRVGVMGVALGIISIGVNLIFGGIGGLVWFVRPLI